VKGKQHPGGAASAAKNTPWHLRLQRSIFIEFQRNVAFLLSPRRQPARYGQGEYVEANRGRPYAFNADLLRRHTLELPKNRRRTEISASSSWQPDAVGRHDFNLEIDVGSYPPQRHWRWPFVHPNSGRRKACEQ
jgi:hypothetical protein